MKKTPVLFLAALCTLFILACQTTSTAPAEGWTAGIQPYVKRQCINNDECAEVKIYLPLYRGDQSATLGAFNEKIQRHLLTILQPPTGLPIETTLDSLAVSFFKEYSDYKKFNTGKTENWEMSLIATVSLLTPQITTVEARQHFTINRGQKVDMLHLISYDFRTEKYLTMVDLAPDTAALRPILERAFASARQLNTPEEIKQSLLPTFDRLPMPRYVGLYPEGIRIVYNYTEYSLFEVPVVDFRLSWEQLDGLVDRTKWLE